MINTYGSLHFRELKHVKFKGTVKFGLKLQLTKVMRIKKGGSKKFHLFKISKSHHSRTECPMTLWNFEQVKFF